jgi:hypothetical protein
MKNLTKSILLSTTLVLGTFAIALGQEEKTAVETQAEEISSEELDITKKVVVHQGVHTNKDTTRISFGKTKIIILGPDNEANSKDDDDDDYGHCKGCKGQRYNHFAGIDLGVNGFLNPEMSVDLQKEGQFMDLNYRKSISLALNLWEWYIPIAKEKFGIVSGLGVEFNNYTLDRDLTVFSDEDTTFGITDASKNIEKNKFKSTMINVPLMLETNIGKDAEHSFHLALGGQVSYRLGSKTKQIYEQAGKDYKVKNRNDYNMNDFRFNAIGRIGYGDFTLFAAYSSYCVKSKIIHVVVVSV